MKRILAAECLVAIVLTTSTVIADEKRGGSEANSISKHNYEITDKNNTVYVLSENYSMKHGKMLSIYGLSNKSDTNDATLILEGYSDGESGGCGRWKSLEISNAILDIKFSVLDVNDDDYKDIVAQVLEKNCQSKKLKQSLIVLYSSEHGFIKEVF